MKQLFYKMVVHNNGRFFSIFDGREYKLGEPVSVTPKECTHMKNNNEVDMEGHRGGFYVYCTPEKALAAELPRRSRLLRSNRVVLEVLTDGQFCIYGDKIAFERIVPLNVTSPEFRPSWAN
eukprot:GHVR01032956.1.p1 GENE.GHVR01032956.1~~GHVR01032956.1.p1  ORF type:complete len:121 (-),score=17.50 GHVR01032956.1:42-404(-)